MKLLKVIDGEYISGYQLEILFNTGEKKRVNLEEELWGEMFEPLKNLSFFQKFSFPHNTIEWENGADFAPEFLYKIGK